EYPLAPADSVERWQKQKNDLDSLERELKEFLKRETEQVGEILAGQISQYLLATARLQLGRPQPEKLDSVVQERWGAYLKGTKEHPYLRQWDALVAQNARDEDLQKEADAFQSLALSVIREKRELDAKKGSLKTSKAILRKDLYFSSPRPDLPYRPPRGLLYFGEVNQYPQMEREVIRFLDGDRLKHVNGLIAEIERLQISLPPKYPYLNGIADSDKPAKLKVQIGGSPEN